MADWHALLVPADLLFTDDCKEEVNNDLIFPLIWSHCSSFDSSSRKMVQAVLFEDIFDVRVLNENGKKFERGSTFGYYSLYKIAELHGVLHYNPQ